MQYNNLKYLAMSLPEDILREKWSGHFRNAEALIEKRLSDKNLPYAMRCRLELEKNNIKLIKENYTISKEEALAQIRERIPDFTEAELDEVVLENKADHAYVEGELKFLHSFCAALFRVYPEIWKRAGNNGTDDYSMLLDFISDLKDGQDTVSHIHIRHSLSLRPEAVRKGETLHVHLPLPCERAGVRNLKILETVPSPVKLPEASEPQPTVYFEEPAAEDQTFVVEYAFDHTQRYVDTSKADLKAIAAAEIPEEEKQYLAEELPHIQFTPYIRALAEELRAGETNPLLVARKFYDYITTQVEYRFMRDYGSVDNLSEYCAVNRRGDCGVQALLFIALCRVSGIPARWESGLDAKPDDVGEHDWAMFYIPSMGWLHADPSYGGSAHTRGLTKLWNYFFGNVDPYRVPTNNALQGEFVPAKKYLRTDPCDNQDGEAEYDDRRVEAREMICTFEDKGIK